VGLAGTLNVVPAANFNPYTDIPAGLNLLQFIQASNVINGSFTVINNSVPGFSGTTYETLDNNQGWLQFTFVAPSITPHSTPIPHQTITTSKITNINTFLTKVLFKLQNQFNSAVRRIEEEKGHENNDQNKQEYQRRKSIYTPSLAEFPTAPSQTMSSPIIAAAQPQLAFMNFQPQVKQQQLRSGIAEGEISRPWHVYFGPTGNIGSVNNKHTQLGCNYRSVGGLAGFDYAFSQVGAGLMLDYENVKANVHKHAGEFWVNQFHATSYATYVPSSFPEFAVNGILGGGGAWYAIQRNIAGLPAKDTAKGKTHGAIVDALIGAQYMFSHRQFTTIPRKLEIIPLFNMQYIYQGLGSYKEHGASFHDLKFSKQGYQSLRSTLGAWLQYTWGSKNFSFTPLIDIEWQREYLDHNHKVRSKPIEFAGPSGSTTIFGAGRDTLLAGLDMMFKFYQVYGLEVSYDFEYNSLYRNNGFFLGLNISY
jgi:uncharacterized protein with beta-barrel porin domain